MSDRMPINPFYQNAHRPGQVRPPTAPVTSREQTSATPQTTQANGSFQQILQKKLLSFSSHAELRLKQRGITFRTEQIEQINEAIDKAAAKGAKDSLVLMKDTALIVNIKNRTVITAMDNESLKDHVFTQIDSAVIIP